MMLNLWEEKEEEMFFLLNNINPNRCESELKFKTDSNDVGHGSFCIFSAFFPRRVTTLYVEQTHTHTHTRVSHSQRPALFFEVLGYSIALNAYSSLAFFFIHLSADFVYLSFDSISASSAQLIVFFVHMGKCVFMWAWIEW